MKDSLKQTLLGFLYGIILCAVLSMCTSCRTRYIEVPTVHEEYVYQTRNRVVHDSIYTHDSIRIYLKNDTVYQDRVKTMYVNKPQILFDTLIIYKDREKSVPVEVIKKVPDFRGWIAALILLCIVILLSKSKFR